MFPGATGSRITIDGRVEEVDQEGPRAFDIVVSPSYFETFRVPIVSGRAIASRDIEGALPVAVIGRETARRYWSESDPIGQRFKLGSLSDDSPWMTIVGVAGDVQTHSHSIRNTKMKSANVFLPIAQHRRRAASVAIRASVEPTGLAAGARQAIWSIDPRLPVDNIMSMPAAIAQTDTQNTFFLRVLTGLSLVALLLAGVGIYGIIAFAVNQRSHEIGIRMALGAKPSGILMLVIRQGAVLTLIGIVLGVAGAVAFVRFFGAQLEGIQVANASGALTYVSVSLMLIVVANLASFLPARRAVNVDPLVVLRYE
jgi:putative ABC transport system permease protein